MPAEDCKEITMDWNTASVKSGNRHKEARVAAAHGLEHDNGQSVH